MDFGKIIRLNIQTEQIIETQVKPDVENTDKSKTKNLFLRNLRPN
jgi:hypothetical protein